MSRVHCIMLALAAVACGRETGGVAATTPQLSDACALHGTAEACKADAQCEVRPNGVTCPAGTACVDFACVSRGAPPGSGLPGNPASCACMMTGSGGGAEQAGVCIEQLGGPPRRADAPPPLSCRPTCAPSTPEGLCGCMAQGLIERCTTSPSVENLCACDNGVR